MSRFGYESRIFVTILRLTANFGMSANSETSGELETILQEFCLWCCRTWWFWIHQKKIVGLWMMDKSPPLLRSI